MALTPIAIAASLSSSAAWVGFDAARKSLSTRIDTVPLVLWLMVGQCPVFIAWWLATGTYTIGPGYWVPGTIDLIGNVAANLLFIRAVRIGELSTTIPILSFTPVFTSGVAVVLLGELPSVLQLLGIAAVVIGAFTLNLKGGLGFRGWWRRVAANRGAHLMAIVALIWSATASIDKLALAHAPVPFHAFYQCAGIAVTLIVYLVASGRLHEVAGIGDHLPRFGLAVLLSVLAMGLQLVAIQMMYVSFMEAFKRAVGMIGAMVLGRLLFGEAISGEKVLAVVAMSAGVGLILLA